MSEDITYASLKLPESRKTENIQELDRSGTKGKFWSYRYVGNLVIISIFFQLEFLIRPFIFSKNSEFI